MNTNDADAEQSVLNGAISGLTSLFQQTEFGQRLIAEQRRQAINNFLSDPVNLMLAAGIVFLVGRGSK